MVSLTPTNIQSSIDCVSSERVSCCDVCALWSMIACVFRDIDCECTNEYSIDHDAVVDYEVMKNV
jgi:hypothetical protein